MSAFFNQSGNIHNINRCRDYLIGGLKILQVVESGIGYIHNPHIGLAGGKGKTGGFNLGVGHTIEKGGLANVSHTDNPAFKCHLSEFWLKISKKEAPLGDEVLNING